MFSVRPSGWVCGAMRADGAPAKRGTEARRQRERAAALAPPCSDIQKAALCLKAKVFSSLACAFLFASHTGRLFTLIRNSNTTTSAYVVAFGAT